MLGFDNKKYLEIQSKKIKERFNLFDKLYVNFNILKYLFPVSLLNFGNTKPHITLRCSFFNDFDNSLKLWIFLTLININGRILLSLFDLMNS